MASRAEVLWISNVLASAEHCVVADAVGERALAGTVVLPIHGGPATISYTVDVNADWTTRLAAIDVDAAERSMRILVSHVDGIWTVNGVERADLAGCEHIDLGWSPVTNTLPLRSARLEVGNSCSARSAWIRFPELDVVASDQTYTRRDETVVGYQSATFEADLVVTPDQIVTMYGEGLWHAAELRRVR